VHGSTVRPDDDERHERLSFLGHVGDVDAGRAEGVERARGHALERVADRHQEHVLVDRQVVEIAGKLIGVLAASACVEEL